MAPAGFPSLLFFALSFLVASSVLQSCDALELLEPATSQMCNITAGQWVRAKSVLYSATSNKLSFACDCSSRKDKTYLRWQWVAPGCTINRIDQDPESFLKTISKRNMLIAGDSISRNLYEAFAWAVPRSLLSAAPTSGSFTSSKYSATVQWVWSRFYTATLDKKDSRNHIVLDKIDPAFASIFQKYRYVVLQGFRHFFLKTNAYYKNGKLLPNYSNTDALRDATVFLREYVKKQKFFGTVLVLTFTPSHGSCGKRFTPFTKKEAAAAYNPSVSRVITEVFGSAGNQFKVVHTNYLSVWRPDAHCGVEAAPGVYPDCTHWCVPGVPNTWADIVYSMMAGSLATT